jgi:8-oxo-dGTP pyrophosphatase MutT (NUDIX family)
MAARIAAIRETLEETGLALGFTRGQHAKRRWRRAPFYRPGPPWPTC